MNSVPTRTVLMYLSRLPRWEASRTLQQVNTIRIAHAPPKATAAREAERAMRDLALGQQRGTSGLATLTRLRAANDKARAEGMLFEQRRARGEVVV